MRHVVDGPGGTRYVVAAEPDPTAPTADEIEADEVVAEPHEGPNLALLLSGADVLAEGPWRVRVEGHAEAVFSVPSGDVAQRLVLLLGEELETGVWAPDAAPTTPPTAAA